jgi:hypothetical protein
VDVVFNIPAEAVTATTAANYTFAPEIQIVHAEMNPAVPENTHVLLSVDGLAPDNNYLLTAKDILSNSGLKLNPDHDAVIVRT